MTTGYFYTDAAIGNREDLSDVLTNISPTSTPFFSSIGKTSAKNTLHEWQTDSLATAASAGGNVAVEGAAASAASGAVTTRLGNRTQIFQNVVAVTNTELAMNPAGRENEWAYQMKKRAAELARDIERQLVESSAQSAGSTVGGAGRQLEGLGLGGYANSTSASANLAGYLSANALIGSAFGIAGGVSAASARHNLTETTFNDLLQQVWADGGMPDMVLCGGYLKRVLSSFSANATRYTSISDQDRKLVNSVSVYESDFGMVQLKISHFINATKLGVITTDHFKVAELRGLEFSKMAKDGDRELGQFVYEATLAAYAPAGGGMAMNLASAAGATATG